MIIDCQPYNGRPGHIYSFTSLTYLRFTLAAEAVVASRFPRKEPYELVSRSNDLNAAMAKTFAYFGRIGIVIGKAGLSLKKWRICWASLVLWPKAEIIGARSREPETQRMAKVSSSASPPPGDVPLVAAMVRSRPSVQIQAFN